jgi:CRISPR-associated protein Cas1
MLNEFTYCPRLGYLEWVQAEWAENLETLQGTFGHRNVDKPDRKQFPAPSSDQPPVRDDIHARSITLSAPAEGLLAKLDLLELEGNTATPVDYKRGTVPDNDERSYEPERVQLCAQGLILRENGFESQEGVLYYIASRKRVTVPFTEELIARTRQQAAEFRRTAADGHIPSPLVDSPKCPRCSLVGICLPDETNLLRSLGQVHSLEDEEDVEKPAAELPPANRLRPLVVSRDDALPLYLQDYGLSLTKAGDELIVKKKGAEVRSVKLKDVSQVCVFGSVYVTEPALRELALRGLPLCHFTFGGWFYAQTTGLTHKNVELRLHQYAAATDSARCVTLARRFVIGKIRNCRTLLRRHLETPDKEKILYQLNDYARKAEACESLESLLGIEGTAARVYFSGFKRLLQEDGSFDIEGRNRRPPRDPVNALLSFVYSLLTKDLTVTVNAVGLDPFLGVYHQPRYGKPALALDLAEEFRPLIADSTVLTLINNGEVTRNDFLERAGAVTLTDAGRKAVMGAYERRMESEVTHPLFGYRASYRRLLEVQCRLFARTLSGEVAEYPVFTTR